MNFTEIIKELAFAIITASVPVLVTYAVKYFNTLKKHVEVETEGLAIHNTLTEVLDLILSVVMKISQTYVDSLKASGTFDEAAQKKAFNDAKEEIMSLLNEDAKDVIKILYNDVENWIAVQIESAVRRIKM